MAKKQPNFRRLRSKLGLNQQQFWSRIGVTQSGGSRYEGGREAPQTVQKLVGIAYGSENQRARELARLGVRQAQ